MNRTVPILVMAASRAGARDPLAASQGVTHKCLIRIDGRIMIERVVDALLASGRCGTVYVSIDAPDVLRQVPEFLPELERGRIVPVPAAGNLASSVLAALPRLRLDGWPLVITTGDNAVHTPELVRDFVDGTLASRADAVAGITHETDVTPSIPDSGLAWHRLRDGGFSSCNLYGLNNDKAIEAVRIFEGGGQFGKKHWRILKAFGVLPFVLYKTRFATTEQLFARISRNLELKVAPVWLPYPYGPIDVDNLQSFALSERLLRERR
jgi:CTP:molybdopterin cytidylyltransferase MocA